MKHLLIALLALTAPIHAATGGPDSFGYTYIDSSEGGGPAFSWIDATPGTALGLLDDEETTISAPFDITFYGVTSTDLVIGNNGGITFNSIFDDFGAGNTAMTTASDYFIAPFWDDIDDVAGDVYTHTIGVAPNRQFIVAWVDRPHYPATGAGSFQVVFTEGSQEILFQYLDVDFGDVQYDFGASATVGIHGTNSGDTLEYSFNTASLSNNLAILFAPPAVTLPNFDTSTKIATDTYSRTTKANDYTLTITNSGSGASSGTTVVDPIPAGASYVSASLSTTGSPAATYNGTLDQIEWGPGNIGTASSIQISYQLQYTTTSLALITNTATIDDPDVGQSTISDSVQLIDPPQTAGTDSIGYYCLDSYSIGGPTYSWYDAAGSGLPLLLDDEDEQLVSLPFPIRFYNQAYTEFTVGNNGAINFSGATVSFANASLDTETEPMIAPLWDDYDDAGDVYVAIIGSAPTRRVVIQWNQVSHISTSGSVTFQFVFLEEDDDFLFQYQDVEFVSTISQNRGGTATVGITSGAGASETVQYSFDQPFLEDGLAIEFIKPGVFVTVEDWMILND